MPYHFPLDGIEVSCDTFEEFQKAVAHFGKRIGEVKFRKPKVGAAKTGDKPSPKRRRSRTKFGGPEGVSKGPARLWAQAAYQSAKTGQERNAARSGLSDLRRDSPRRFLDFSEEFDGFVAWYAKKGKIDPPTLAEPALSELFESDVVQYTTLVKQYMKEHKIRK